MAELDDSVTCTLANLWNSRSIGMAKLPNPDNGQRLKNNDQQIHDQIPS